MARVIDQEYDNDCNLIEVTVEDDGEYIHLERVRHGEWVDGRCSECETEAPSTSWDEPVYDYDWEENLRYSHTETHTEYLVTNYCPNCGAKMDKGVEV